MRQSCSAPPWTRRETGSASGAFLNGVWEGDRWVLGKTGASAVRWRHNNREPRGSRLSCPAFASNLHLYASGSSNRDEETLPALRDGRVHRGPLARATADRGADSGE